MGKRITIVLDDDLVNAEDSGEDPGNLVNEDDADVGVRTSLGIPVDTVVGVPGTTRSLMTGEVGDEGWFALKTIPSSWAAAGPTGDGLANYILAGPGLGTGDALCMV